MSILTDSCTYPRLWIQQVSSVLYFSFEMDEEDRNQCLIYL